MISLDDPIVVLQIIQAQFGSDPPEVSLQLASRGIPFGIRTISEIMPTSITSYPESLISLGVVPSNYQPLPSNYLSYLDKRDRLLQQSYGRATLMKGGIIAHLAHNFLGDRMDVLIRGGPSKDVFKYSMAIKIGQEYLWDDNLDPNNKQIICGMYKVSNGGSTLPTSTSH